MGERCVVKVMLDTNVFNHLVTGEISPNDIPSHWRLIATHLQHKELMATPDGLYRDKLAAIFQEYVTLEVPVGAGVWDVTQFDATLWPDDVVLFESLLSELIAKKRRKNSSNEIDAAIGYTCLRSGFELVTNDCALKHGVRNRGGVVHDLRTMPEGG